MPDKSGIGTPTTFKSFAEMFRPKVYDTIRKYLPEGYPEKHNEIVRCYSDRMGQYRRPSYLIAWTLLYNGNAEEAILPAAIQQTSEDWLLMIDDWMDGNQLRRGKAAAPTIYPPTLVINGASHLQAINWKMVHDAMVALGPDRGERYFNKFYDIICVTHVGQYLDIRLTKEVKDITKFSPEEYYESIQAKAGYYTVYGPMQQGAIVAGVDDETVDKIAEYGIPAGQAFQIKDDILDCISTEDVLGKSIGNDVRDGCKNIILWHAVQHGSSNEVSRLKEIYAKDRPQKTEADVKFVIDTFKGLGSIDYAQKESERLGALALDNFERLTSGIPESVAKKVARDSISNTASRSK